MWRFRGADGEVAIDVKGSLRANSGEALRNVALNGVGIVLQPALVVAEDLAAGRLVSLLPDHAAPKLPRHLLTLPSRLPTPKLRSFVDHVVQEFARALSTAETD